MFEQRPEQLQIFCGLKEAISSKRCVAFLGSGLSAGCYPTWADLVNALCESCGSSQRVNSDSPTDAYLDAAQDAKDLGEENYYSFLGKTFGRRADRAPLTYDAALALPFDAYVTVNLDPLLALKGRAARQPCSNDVNAYPALDRRKMGNRSIHYLHGYIEENGTPLAGTIVLARSEFEEAYRDTGPLVNFLVPLLENESIVFMGCRLREPVMEPVFRICKQHQLDRQDILRRKNQRADPPPRFILLPVPEVTDALGRIDLARGREEQQEQADYYRQMDIIPAWYHAPGGDHSELRTVLEKLAELKAPRVDYGWGGGSYAD